MRAGSDDRALEGFAIQQCVHQRNFERTPFQTPHSRAPFFSKMVDSAIEIDGLDGKSETSQEKQE
jgi:hypothetical protein